MGLVLNTGEGEKIYIGDNITVARSSCGRKLIIEAPKDVLILSAANKAKGDEYERSRKKINQADDEKTSLENMETTEKHHEA